MQVIYFYFTCLLIEAIMERERARERERSLLCIFTLAFINTWYSLILVTRNINPNIGWCQNLTYFDAGYNNLTGSIPSSIGGLKQLQTLSLEGNQLTGKLCDGQTKLWNQTLLIHNQTVNIWSFLIFVCRGWLLCKSISIKTHAYKRN